MNYVKYSNFKGTSTKEITCITGAGAPTISTEGAVGVLYMDTDTGAVYKCTNVNAGKTAYTWETFGGGGEVNTDEIVSKVIETGTDEIVSKVIDALDLTNVEEVGY